MANPTDLTLGDLWREFPGWECWEGVAGLVYCRKTLSSPPIVFRATSPAGLREQILDYRANGRRQPRADDGRGLH